MVFWSTAKEQTRANLTIFWAISSKGILAIKVTPWRAPITLIIQLNLRYWFLTCRRSSYSPLKKVWSKGIYAFRDAHIVDTHEPTARKGNVWVVKHLWIWKMSQIWNLRNIHCWSCHIFKRQTTWAIGDWDYVPVSQHCEDNLHSIGPPLHYLDI